MQIPYFPLPSNPLKEIQFRMPTVADAMSYSGAAVDQEEALTTRYLNEMQYGEKYDAALWTAQDRRTALWWIFCNSRIDTVLSVSYSCTHCGEEHYYDVNIRDLDMTAGLLTVEPFVPVTIPVNGKPYEWVLRPLNGLAMEHLEAARIALPPTDDPSYTEELINIRLMEIAHQAHLKDQPSSFIESAQLRYELIKQMATDTEFSPLVAQIALMNRTLVHGLSMKIEKGTTNLLLPAHSCPNSGKEGSAVHNTNLFTPFRSHDFFPNFRPQWMAGINN
ncbi:hypothetical protein [Yersinia ruckeri]|uniref:hypothetical protein n=1 Tax=Yersinia ruckeri TaxID=29486 RepID=UPI0020BDB8EE|nr:hypothetical protein [Yersinia ruckeri]EKN4689562.1 hypothetical protein [Yersinia ruckeri]MCK8586592.1 hypothetical protein [Yersinia ruckeri]MCW6615852.1 hypothetical protein [Yersinia ruckeri]